MIGVFFFATLFVWATLCIYFSTKFAEVIGVKKWRTLTICAQFPLVFSVPIIDEVVGKYQFERLCRANGITSADFSKAAGMKLKETLSEPRRVGGTILPIDESIFSYFSAETDEFVTSYKIYRSSGGWLVRYTWLGIGVNQPRLFAGYCDNFSDRQKIFVEKNIELSK